MSHYFSKEQTSKPKIKKIIINVLNTEFELFTASGIFSKDKLDKGTELLINSAIIQLDSKVLDLGCGYGVVGISIAKTHPKTKVLMTDINERAIKMANRNIKLNRLKNVEARQSDSFKNIQENFNTILLNPPQTAGKETCYNLVKESKNHLEKNGTFQLVVRKKKGGQIIYNMMEEIFNNVEETAKKAGYIIYLSKKS